ncbi:MAG: hypothetical protein AM324_013075 [Candidatus Thorarchaeota archaeon SMTZ1-83]|nr:MAG: hypothetical protein AM324_14215 [Candidatus Thorarchaeota archaeon SMTZ1-83]
MTPPSDRYIAVDKSRVMRCQWCGTAESRRWIRDEGGPWCSEACQSASRLENETCGALFCVFSILVIFSASIQRGMVLDVTTGLIMILFLLSCPAVLFGSSIMSGLQTRKQIPRYSRRAGRTLETAGFFCANCGGALEVEVGMTMAECAYCGATNEIVMR